VTSSVQEKYGKPISVRGILIWIEDGVSVAGGSLLTIETALSHVSLSLNTMKIKPFRAIEKANDQANKELGKRFDDPKYKAMKQRMAKTRPSSQ
jgi:hypothetical protein